MNRKRPATGCLSNGWWRGAFPAQKSLKKSQFALKIAKIASDVPLHSKDRHLVFVEFLSLRNFAHITVVVDLSNWFRGWTEEGVNHGVALECGGSVGGAGGTTLTPSNSCGGLLGT
ncbi:hypothetical protein DFH09DRAFT_1078449 [Mycena vulgaris]|nr:hypothetical protein DFH09DRAFT_1078449 [Mycena vulgaris]